MVKENPIPTSTVYGISALKEKIGLKLTENGIRTYLFSHEEKQLTKEGAFS
ncbi:MAG: hypothetical protein ACMUEM_00365 [Flavobacteriales bacterium AspAUS03]